MKKKEKQSKAPRKNLKRVRPERESNDEEAPETLKAAHACELCDRTFRTTGGLKIHISQLHMSTYRCKLCNNGQPPIHGEKAVQIHFQDEHADKDQDDWEAAVEIIEEHHTCEQCQKSFGTRNALGGHKAQLHSTYRCELCDETCVGMQALRKHKRADHKKTTRERDNGDDHE